MKKGGKRDNFITYENDGMRKIKMAGKEKRKRKKASDGMIKEMDGKRKIRSTGYAKWTKA